jgi:outer membrane protein TolC
MKQAVMLAQEHSISSMVNRNLFASAWWQYRSYRADRLPSLNLSAGLGNVERAIVPLSDANTGAVNYREIFTLSNDLSLYIQQKISATGGTVSLRSSLQRFDQFSPDNLTWNSRPITLTYMQPLFGYNAFKWSRRVEPHNFERAKLEYLENMESVTIVTVGYFWELALAELDRTIAAENYENSRRLYRIAGERYRIGSLGRDEVLQMELRVLTDSLAINTSLIDYTSARNRLASFIGAREETDLALSIDYTLPNITMDHDRVLSTALRNSSFETAQRVALLEAEREIARAKADRGIDVGFNARFGLSQSDRTFPRAYSHLRDEEVAGFTVSIPILDWGVGRGRVRMAQAAAATVQYRQEQARVDHEQEIFVRVMEFNALGRQCEVSRRAGEIADERFALSVESFTRGALSVTELGVAQSDRDRARREYISNLRDYWNAYFTLRRLTLYDYLSGTDIGAEFDRLIER